MKSNKMFLVLPAFALVLMGGVYTSSYASTTQYPRGQVLTAEQKSVINTMRTLHMQGKHEEARALAVQNGMVKQGFGQRPSMQVMKRNHSAIHDAIINKNFSAFSVAVAGTPLASKVTEPVFLKLTEAHDLRAKGDHAGAQKIMQDLGLQGFGGLHKAKKNK